jgi:hypothetical protein
MDGVGVAEGLVTPIVAAMLKVPSVPPQSISPGKIAGYPTPVVQLAGVHVPEKTTAPLKSMVATCPAPVVIFRTGGGGSALATVAKPIINVKIRNAIRNLIS